MKLISTNLLLLLALFFCIQLHAQNSITTNPSGGEYIYEKNDVQHPCISAQEYQLLDAEIARNNNLLGINFSSQNRLITTLLSWPIKAAASLTDCGYNFIGAYVDQDTTSGNIKDFNCLTNTYDGHRGTDISIWPYSFYKMDNNQVEVIAAAAGTIVARSDGFFDRNCTSNNNTANYIIIQHADGSQALYWHMKKNSVTSKTVGQTVTAGEYLGIVGSSGSSSGPHLHFEVWSGTTSATRKDPYSGTCNYLNATSWWTAQKPHTEPQILKVSVNTTDLVFPGCPTTETSNESSSYTIPFQGAGLPAGYAKFYIFLRELPVSSTVDLKILNPNGSTFNSWTYNVSTFYKASYFGWSKLLPTIAGTYKFQATYNGVTCSKNFDIVTNSAIATITASGPTTFCQGDSVILTANAGSSYLWNNGATTRSITVKTNGSFSVTVTNASGNSATSATTTVAVNSLPTATITASGNTTFCQGDSVVLTASAGSSYLWNNGATTRSITVKTNGSFSVKVTNANNCSATSAATTVAVNSLPTATITATGNTTFCQGDSVILTASAGTSYLWNNGATTRNITVKNNGSFSVKVTNANNCSATSTTTTVIVNTLPFATITASRNTTFCQGDSVVLTASAGSSYLWNNGATTRSITVKTNGSFSVKVTNANNCSATSATTTVAVNSLPTATITATGNTTFCQGDSVILTASAGTSYLWNNGATTRNITVKNNGSFSVKVTNANNCSATSTTTTVIVNALPIATITASRNTTFCQGDSVVLTASAGSSYLWNNGATTRSITVKTNGSFSVKVTNANNCSATSATTTVAVNSLPTATITATGNTTFCQGDSVVLTASAGSSYLWNNGATTRSITVKTNGSFSVKVTNANNCSATSATTTTTARTPQNNLTIILRNDTLFSPYTAPAKWYLTGNPNSIDNKLFHVCSSSGNYYVTGRDVNGCNATSATFSANCSITSILNKSNSASFNIFPNPTSTILNIFGSDIENGNYKLVLRNIIGQILIEDNISIRNNSIEKTISIAHLANDIYFLSIESEDAIIVRKILKQY